MIDFPPLPTDVDPDVGHAIHAAFEARSFGLARQLAVRHGLGRRCLICFKPAGFRVNVCGECWQTYRVELESYDEQPVHRGLFGTTPIRRR